MSVKLLPVKKRTEPTLDNVHDAIFFYDTTSDGDLKLNQFQVVNIRCWQ